MKLEILREKVEEFRAENNLGKKVTRLLLEAWRRFYMFEHKAEKGTKLEDRWLGLGYKSTYNKGREKLFTPIEGQPVIKALNWWKLTDKGVEVFKKLDKKIAWDYSYSQPIFDGEVI